MAGRRVIYLLSLAGTFAFFVAYQLWFSWFALVLVLILPWVSLVLSLPAMRRAQLDTSVFTPARQNAQRRLTLTCGKMPTLPWRCKLRADRPLTAEAFLLFPNDYFPTEKCGTMLCSVQKLKVYDYLGLFSRTLKYPEQFRMPIYPLPVSAALPDKACFSAMSWRPKWGGGFSENHELRLYRPGDNIQQIHWKLSAKTGSLIFRQSMEPVRSQLLVRLDLSGDQEVLERKLGKLLWIGPMLLQQKLDFHIQALTGDGARVWSVTDHKSFATAYDALLCAPRTDEQVPAVIPGVTRQYYIGGDADET